MVKMIITIIDIITIFKIIEFIYQKQYACAIIYFYALYVRMQYSCFLLVHRKTEGLYPVMAGLLLFCAAPARDRVLRSGIKFKINFRSIP